jgi:hypothetical protein
MRMPSPRPSPPHAPTPTPTVRKTMRPQTQRTATALMGEQEVQALRERLPLNRASRAPAIGSGEALAFSILEFCRRHGISRAHFYNLWKSGDGPAVMRVGRRTLISAEAAAEWRMRMQDVACAALTPQTVVTIDERRLP